MIEASTTCPGCGHELSVCICDERSPFFAELRLAVAHRLAHAGVAAAGLIASC